MGEKKQFRAIKGTRDITPPDSALWNWFEAAARETFERYGFRDIRTPIFEETELFARSIGEETDVVAKEMYTFEDRTNIRVGYPETVEKVIASNEAVQAAWKLGRIPQTEENAIRVGLIQNACNLISDGGAPALLRFVAELHALDLGESLTLRPEGTASVVRAYIEHGMQTLAGNQKLYYMGPMFRRERPQKGRYRQFYQIGAEVLGQSDAPGIDAELIAMLLDFFRRVRLKNIKLQVNSIGCKDCRPKYVELLREELRKVKDGLGEDSQRRIDTNPLRVLDSKAPEEQPIIEKLPRISEHLCEACRKHFEALKVEMKLRGVEWEENWRLVRGLDYYTRTTFEVTAAGLGSQNAVCGGGRYDGLVEMLGGPPTKGIGFAIGSDRAILSIQEGGDLPDLPGLAVFVAWMGEKAYLPAIQITRKLREAGVAVELPAEEMKFKKSLGLADKLGARYALILGEDEVASKQFTLKNLSTGKQDKFDENVLLEYLESERRGTRA
ncbi:MAG TPA: histidine--tRNA ligase [Candidatus Acidoferrales bacterium]|nr:histidine--tRNA ligase [Candidatus Acidoferrales bacterium]